MSSETALVPLATGGSRAPLFLVNTVAADAIEFQALSSRLGPDQPLYVLQPFVTAGADPLRRTVESIAHHCLLEIRKVQPHGPFIIGGRSFGAVVAYELAVRLESAGEKVELFTAIDSVRPGVAHPAPRQRRGLRPGDECGPGQSGSRGSGLRRCVLRCGCG